MNSPELFVAVSSKELNEGTVCPKEIKVETTKIRVSKNLFMPFSSRCNSPAINTGSVEYNCH
jgi:hypothetical protein